ncbi:DUF924 family protein [Aurantiacibacter aquimixticola]|uniref:DUF924 domain-containing protein n=1 Tax=Aurantiacibacter aquimixticola TaxID=1958945 RepID=A0A419RUA2_9SPHN|nr:DUF924 family protein [Aurantiacibacter aquimixticola]RJY09371.1 DUF924 domain-containing protein [Aurantiacibacter aquimixticola]
MALAPRRWAAELLHFWFHRLTPHDWWGGCDMVDRELEKRFRRELEALSDMRAEDFCDRPRGALAAVLLFDQVPRNIFRGSPRAFAFDPLAQDIANMALDRGFAEALPRREAPFLAMPLMHSEHIADQQRALHMFRQLDGGASFAFARSHHRMIARFGRFPHRNAMLGRKSTPAEERAVAAGFSW